jgi:hypothetical protein
MGGKRTLREHRTAAKAWDAARAASTSTRRTSDPNWAAWAEQNARHSRRQLKAQKAGRKGGR